MIVQPYLQFWLLYKISSNRTISSRSTPWTAVVSRVSYTATGGPPLPTGCHRWGKVDFPSTHAPRLSTRTAPELPWKSPENTVVVKSKLQVAETKGGLVNIPRHCLTLSRLFTFVQLWKLSASQPQLILSSFFISSLPSSSVALLLQGNTSNRTSPWASDALTAYLSASTALLASFANSPL